MSIVNTAQTVTGQTNSTVASSNGSKEELASFIAAASPEQSEKDIVSAASSKSVKGSADDRWEEAFANTTPEQWAKLEQMFREDEKEGLLPLDFPEL